MFGHPGDVGEHAGKRRLRGDAVAGDFPPVSVTLLGVTLTGVTGLPGSPEAWPVPAGLSAFHLSALLAYHATRVGPRGRPGQ